MVVNRSRYMILACQTGPTGGVSDPDAHSRTIARPSQEPGRVRHQHIDGSEHQRVSGVANLTAVFFRRTMPRITNPEALWDESLNRQFASGSAPSFSMSQG